jgi:hypothetical protein
MLTKSPLKNGNRQGNPNNAPRCGAKTRRGTKCLSPAMPNGRCRIHGGKSTGYKTQEGRERIRKANLRHGGYTPEAKAAKQQARVELERARQILRDLRRLGEQHR